jgi:subtilisin family serine protease
MRLKLADRSSVELEEFDSTLDAADGRLSLRAAGLEYATSRLSRVATAFFGLRSTLSDTVRKTIAKEPPLGVFREKVSGLIRVVHKEAVIRFRPGVSAATRKKILAVSNLEIVGQSRFVTNQVVVRVTAHKKTGHEMIDLCNVCSDMDEIVFASPNFVSEFHRNTTIVIPKAQWHLKNTAAVSGQKKDEDVKAVEAWKISQGKATITIAVLDDGVDVDHPILKTSIRKKPDPNEPRDLCGRDFFVPDDNSPEHFNPRPKLFRFPFDEMAGNDIHGTPCAGVIASSGKDKSALGIAPKCKLLPVKVFHADDLASEQRVADAIRYASIHADILSCSWSGPVSSDIELALADAGTLGRQGKGSAIFCATGNESASQVAYPARSPHAIAVGASTDNGKLASYSNRGLEVSLVAPSSGGVQGIFTSDVSSPNRGFNLGTAAAGGTDGLHTNSFGGTSSATPLAAGVGALVLSVKPSLTRAELKALLESTADKIGNDHDAATGHSKSFGFGRVNAEAAVKKAKTR